MYMLLLVTEEKDGLVSGTHLQWSCGSLERAIESAWATEAANGYRIEVAVVEALYDAYAFGRQYKNVKRLD